jgi:hypothetical protein
MVITRVTGVSGKADQLFSLAQSKEKFESIGSGGGVKCHVPQDSGTAENSRARICPKKPKPRIPTGGKAALLIIYFVSNLWKMELGQD